MELSQRAGRGGLSQKGLARLESTLRGYVERGELAGLVATLCRGEEQVTITAGVQDLETGIPMGEGTIFRIASMSKAVLSVAALLLVEEGRIDLDQPVDPWLPELAKPQVLRRRDSALEETVPAKRSITLRDLLTLRLGMGIVMEPEGTLPIQEAIAASGISPPFSPIHPPDEFIRRLGSLPLLHQPGEGWMYHRGFEALGVLLERVAGEPLEDLLARRIFAPLGMLDTSYLVPERSLDRLSTCYAVEKETGALVIWDDPKDSRWGRPSVFPPGIDLVTTAGDYLSFCKMLRDGGRFGAERLLSEESVAGLRTDQIAAEQKQAFPFFKGFWDRNGWGFGVSVLTEPDGIASAAGRFGWSGGTGPTFFVDPNEGLIAILLYQRMMDSPKAGAILDDFLRLSYGALG